MNPRARISRADRDPGWAWADEVLAPLRREEMSIDIAPIVMRRLVSSGLLMRPRPGPRTASRFAWAASTILGFASLAFLMSALAVLIAGGDEGLQMLWAALAPLGRLAIAAIEGLARFAATLVAAGATVMRGFWILFETAAPLLRGAGLLGASIGLLSIIISTFIFAHARKFAPLATASKNIPLQGGLR